VIARERLGVAVADAVTARISDVRNHGAVEENPCSAADARRPLRIVKQGRELLARRKRQYYQPVHDLTGLETIFTSAGFRPVQLAVTAPVGDVTGVPEMLDHRVVTLHPKVHGGILALREGLACLGFCRFSRFGLVSLGFDHSFYSRALLNLPKWPNTMQRTLRFVKRLGVTLVY